MKTIGIILRGFEENRKKFIGTRKDLFNSLYEYDINVMGIPINNDFKKIINLVNLCDGIILSGGDNFIHNDFLLVEYLYKKNIPTLGICLGMQIMAKYFSKLDEVKVFNHQSNNKYVHEIIINKESLLYKILNKDKIMVNSRHNSAIEDTSLDIVAKSNDNVIEAVEDKNKKFFVGVQWHPESLDDINTKNLFEYFINIC